MRLQTLLCDEITSELGELSKIPVGTDEYKTAVEGIAKLMAHALESERLNQEFGAKDMDREMDYEFKLKQLEEDRKDRRVKNIIAFAAIMVPAFGAAWGTIKSLKFEETGTVTTMAGRNHINKLLSFIGIGRK